MRTRSAQPLRSLWSVTVLLGAALLPARARAEEPCGAFTWDLTLERALYGEAPDAQIAGSDIQSAPTLYADSLYALQLKPEHDVGFVVTPGSKKRGEGTYGGLAQFSPSPPGTYRVSADQAVWFDVVLHGHAIASKDYQGHDGCNAPHKVVEFDLMSADTLTLQISGAAKPLVRLTLTPAPANPNATVSAPIAAPAATTP